jgi:SnoaL-like domain
MAEPSRDDIVEAVHRSWWSVDRDFGSGSELHFTDDGECLMPALAMRGRSEIATGYAKRQANGPRLSRHLVSNLVVDVHAAGRASATYVVALFAGNGSAPLAVDSPSAICDVHDEYALDNGRWLIARRELAAVFVSPTNDSVMLPREERG